MLDEKSRQDVDTNLQDVAQIPGRRLRLWPFVCRGLYPGPDEEHGAGMSIGTGKNRSISVLPSRFYSGGDRICCFVPPKTFIWNQLMWTTSVWP